MRSTEHPIEVFFRELREEAELGPDVELEVAHGPKGYQVRIASREAYNDIPVWNEVPETAGDFFVRREAVKRAKEYPRPGSLDADVLQLMAGPCGPRTATQIAKIIGRPKRDVIRVCLVLVGYGFLRNATGKGQRAVRYIHRDWSVEVSRAYLVETHGEGYARKNWPNLWKEHA